MLNVKHGDMYKIYEKHGYMFGDFANLQRHGYMLTYSHKQNNDSTAKSENEVAQVYRKHLHNTEQG